MTAVFDTAYRAAIVHFTDEPDPHTGAGLEYFEDGVLLVDDRGRVVTVDHARVLQRQGLDLNRCRHSPDWLLMPGLIDSHIHYPQTGVIASYGEQLIDWLNHYTFPAEQAFSDAEYARLEAERFVDLLLAHGTTTAMVYTTVYPQSTDAFFEVARQRDLCMLAGKVMMDRNAPEALLDTATGSDRQCRSLIERWHHNGRLHYALTPRFAPTSTPEQLRLTGELYRTYDDLYLQTHLSENLNELAWVKTLFPDARDYLDVYDRYGLLGERSVFGHGLHLSDVELKRLADTGSSVAFCPTSNLFLGSGLLNARRLTDARVEISIATDVGGGTSFSMLKTLAEGYKVLQLQGQNLNPLQAFYWITLGNARTLKLDHRIGNFAPGKDADFILIDRSSTPLQAYRQARAGTLTESLFALMMLGDENNIASTYVMGRPQFQRQSVTAQQATYV
ncbi:MULTISPECIES: guanine deaminase [unclassified Marinimicrobium]|jgi:guanine deaminase|uniref:guanine deaminase n=1 Tax=unclassified Marinimicrobium TaxID=2632100 RepID=UPI000C5955D4|nr:MULTISPECIES: guanine deaminase [unclassified Marinimicrobium]MAN52906.1 guanine deaminase [Marinimicrobium sp.]